MMGRPDVLLIAVGGIGFRHFQALLNCQSEFDLHVVDISSDAVGRAKAYAAEKGCGRAVHYYASVDELAPSTCFAAAIIATSSLARRPVFEKLVARCSVRTIIFEKVLFPGLEDYEEVGMLLEEKHITAYVNCARRVQSVYRELRKELSGSKRLHLQVRGSNWGLACNGIHMVDLAAWLTPCGSEVVSCNGSLLEDKLYDSKRKGYIEFYGKLMGRIGENTSYLLECDHGQAGISIELFTERAYYFIDEPAGSIVTQPLDGGEAVGRQFAPAFVSQTTTQIMDRLLIGEPIELTGYTESVRLHVPVLQAFLKKQNQIRERESAICPIT